MDKTFLARLEQLIADSIDNVESNTPAKVLAHVGAPSTSIAILEDGQISSHCISTCGDNVNTLFQACSISKAAAGLAITKLIQQGHLKFEDKVCELLPENIVELLAKDTRTRDLFRSVTVEQLMSHTAGLSVHGFPGYPDHDHIPSSTDIVAGSGWTNTVPVVFHSLPGLDFIYSGGGITVLQCVVEHVMNMSFSDIMDTHLFKPLGMTRSCYKLAPQEKNFAKAHYTGRLRCGSEYHVQPELAAAGLWTTPTDLLKLVKAIQESLDGEMPETFLNNETAEKIVTKIKFSMGRSWFVTATGFGHGGSNEPGFRAILFGYADLPWNAKFQGDDEKSKPSLTTKVSRGCGISIMTNAASGESAYWKVVHAISYLKGWAQAPGFYEESDCFVPFRASSTMKNDKRWQDWISPSWSDNWRIARNDKGDAIAGIEKEAMVVLKPAAIPSKQYTNGEESIDFILDGTQILLRLGWDESERVVELCNGLNRTRQILHLERKDRA